MNLLNVHGETLLRQDKSQFIEAKRFSPRAAACLAFAGFCAYAALTSETGTFLTGGALSLAASN